VRYAKLLKQREEDEQWGLVRLLFAPIVGALYLVVLAFKLVFWLVGQIFSWIGTEIYFLKVRGIIAQFGSVLNLRKSQLVVVDQYGVNVVDWEREKVNFIKRFLYPYPPKVTLQRLSRLIDKYLKDLADESVILPLVETAQDYEKFCTDQLTNAGWRTARTKASGDQGIDIVATKDGVSAVFQCKWYSQPVGNKAVQEVLAGKLFQEADLAIVLSNARYTPSARHLANRTGVHLLHHSQIEEFTARLAEEIRPDPATRI
jgi:restriction system protein